LQKARGVIEKKEKKEKYMLKKYIKNICAVIKEHRKNEA
jgi:hypothetical protein